MNGTLARNMFANLLQAILSAALLFALYRYINTTLGVEKFGVWAVVLATVSMSRLVDLGLSGSVTRFVARSLATNDTMKAMQIIDTTLITLFVIVGVFLPALFALMNILLPYVLQGDALLDAIEILPYALASLWLTMLLSVLQGGLEGCQRMDLRLVMVISGQALMLAFSIILVPQHGLVGLAIAQVAQAAFVLFLGRILLCKLLTDLAWLPKRWSRSAFREMIGYGANLQATAIAMLLFDATTKMLLARFGGPAAAGYFEMANQLVQKVRALIIMANQAVVPHVVALTETSPSELKGFYRANLRLLSYFALPVFALLFAWSGVFSWLLIGETRAQFISLVWLVGTAWLFNIFVSPAYFMNLGTGQVGRNTIAHVIMGVTNIALGWLLGSKYGAQGVVVAYVVALVLGSAFVLATSQKFWATEEKTKQHSNANYEHISLIAACCAVFIFSWLVPLQAESTSASCVALVLTFPLLMLGIGMWFNPVRRELIRLAQRNTRAVQR